MFSWSEILTNINVSLWEKEENVDPTQLKSARAISSYLLQLQNPEVDFKDVLSFRTFKTFTERSDLTRVEDNSMPENTRGKGVRDLRFLNLDINAFRKFPSGHPFSVPFSVEKSKPCSLVLVGRNSVGKSSLYDAMEYVFTGQVSEAGLRGQERPSFIRHGDDLAIPEVRISTVSGEFRSYEQVKKFSFSLNSCFCSEADIIEVGNVASSDKYLDGVNLFASSFGFSPLIEIKESLRKYLNTNWNYIADNHAKWEKELSEKEKLVAEAEKRELTLKDLSTSWQNMEKYNKGMEDLLNQYSDEITGMKNSSSFSAEKLSQLIEELFGDLSDFLKPLGFTLVLTEINDLKNKLKARILLPDRHPAQFPLLEGNEDVAYREEKNKELLIQLDNYLHRLSFMYFFQQMITQLEEVAVSQSRLKEEIKQLKDDILRYQLFLGAEHYLATLDKELQSVMSGLRGDIQPFVEKIMELFTGGAKNTEKIKIDENWKISVFYEENLGNVEKPVTVEISPMKFYNTFRYKLFCMMLRISTAVCMMKTHRFLFPIILDDLFYASDFYNRRLIKQFIESFVSISEQILGKNHLQLICFTHDEIVFTAIYEAVRGKRKIGSFLFGRLHDYRSVEKNEKGKYQLYVPLCLDNSKKGRGE